MQGKIRHGRNGWFTWRHSGHEYVHKYSKFTMNQLHSSSRRGYQKLEQQYWMRLASPNCMKKQQSTAKYALSSLLIKLLCLQCFTVNLIENAENRSRSDKIVTTSLVCSFFGAPVAPLS